MNLALVPGPYVGLWKRTFLETQSLRDTTSRVFWLQTQTWHADIRIPADRPQLTAHASLDTLSRADLLALSRQQGFVGVTHVAGDICRWYRYADYQPANGFNDIGRIHFDGNDRLLEYGVEQHYFEIWERVGDGTAENSVLQLQDPNEPLSVLVSVGNWCILVRARRAGLPVAANLESIVASERDETRCREWLDFEISLARRRDRADGWRIQLSTFPWREGEKLIGPKLVMGKGTDPALE